MRSSDSRVHRAGRWPVLVLGAALLSGTLAACSSTASPGGSSTASTDPIPAPPSTTTPV